MTALDPPPPDHRKVHDDGRATLEVAEVEDAVQAVTELAEAHGGSIELVHDHTVAFRVPVDRFRQAFDALETIGRTLSTSIRGADVTDQHLDLTLRIRAQRATRDRLIELLAQATKAEDKLALMRHIQRLTESLDQMESELRIVGDLAARSRITVTLKARELSVRLTDAPAVAELAWISRLGPLTLVPRGVDRHRVRAEPPKGFVAIGNGPYMVSEAARGSRAYVFALDNEPCGDGDFWIDLMQTTLSPGMASAMVATVGSWRVLTLTDVGHEPLTWILAVRIVDDELELLEALHPNPSTRQTHAPAIDAWLRAGGEA